MLKQLLATIALAIFITFAYYYALNNVSRIAFFDQWSPRRLNIDRIAAIHLPNNLTRLCDALIRPKPNDTVLQSMAAKHSEQPEKLADSDYKNINCSTLLQSYILDSRVLPTEEFSFPIAFSIMIYKDVWQFERLLRAIYRQHNYYCVHVDSKSSGTTYEAAQRIQTCLAPFGNVVVAKSRIAVHWSTATQIDAELSCMQELLALSSAWKYLINLTGQEFPLKTMWQLVRILQAFNGANSVEAMIRNMDRNRRAQLEPFAKKYNITPTKGATHIVVVRGYVEYLFKSQLARDMLQHLRSATCPDETYFSTLNHNPHLNVPGGYLGVPEADGSVYPYINRLKNWGSLPCHGFVLRGICVWGVGDLPLLTDVKHKELFVNKLIWNYQHYALDCLEAWYWNMTLNELHNYWETSVEYDVEYYRNLPFSRFHA